MGKALLRRKGNKAFFGMPVEGRYGMPMSVINLLIKKSLTNGTTSHYDGFVNDFGTLFHYLFNYTGKVIGAISCAGPTERMRPIRKTIVDNITASS